MANKKLDEKLQKLVAGMDDAKLIDTHAKVSGYMTAPDATEADKDAYEHDLTIIRAELAARALLHRAA